MAKAAKYSIAMFRYITTRIVLRQRRNGKDALERLSDVTWLCGRMLCSSLFRYISYRGAECRSYRGDEAIYSGDDKCPGTLSIVNLEVLLVGYMLHPFDDFAVELFLDGDVCDRRGGGGTMPVLFAGGKPDDIAWMDVLDRTAFELNPTRSSRNDERLTEWMGVPRRTCTGLKGYACSGNKRRFRRLE